METTVIAIFGMTIQRCKIKCAHIILLAAAERPHRTIMDAIVDSLAKIISNLNRKGNVGE